MKEEMKNIEIEEKYRSRGKQQYHEIIKNSAPGNITRKIKKMI